MKRGKEEILQGLREKKKHISSKYFYDENGDKIFKQIMEMDEYYLPKCERKILKNQTSEIATILKKQSDKWNIIELGAGDGTKTIIFLEKLLENKIDLTYIPLDISENILEENKQNVKEKIPSANVQSVHGNYFETFDKVVSKEVNNLVLFMGSNIGNYGLEEAEEFLTWIQSKMNPNDLILVAFDLKKNPKKVLAAYNDGKGITKEFNMNLLKRLNRELDANFNVNRFDHFPNYDPFTGNTYSYIVSLITQTVKVAGEEILFKENEVIRTEISKKYDLEEIEGLFNKSKLNIINHFMDDEKYYSLSLGKHK